MREQVLALREAPFPHRAFGVGGAGSGRAIHLDRPLSEAEVAAAELERRVRRRP
ncbi:hypothetical protein GCM10023235_70620 [Kitasatospora terrestris]|uniref:Uncharacterized protein n=1 Tax=Kitasatospora terrestris TaxID=258051 RepID=A0ABP9EIR8_9ACTN